MITESNLPQFAAAIAWPVVLLAFVVIAMLFFRKQIAALLSRVKTAKFPGGTEASFGTADAPEIATNTQLELPSQVAALVNARNVQAELESTQDKEAKTDIETTSTNGAVPRSPPSEWWDYYTEGDYQKAYDVNKKKISQTDDKDELVYLKSLNGWLRTIYDFSSGIDELKGVKAEYPKSSSPYSWLHHAYSAKDRYSDALSVLDEGIEKASDVSTLKLAKANVLNELKKYDEALAVLEDLVQTNETSAAYLLMGSIYKVKDQIEQARKAYLQAYRVASGGTSELRAIADFFRDNGEHDIELFFREQLTKLNPKSSDDWAYLANCRLTNSLNGLAMQAYEYATELSQQDETWILANIGNLYNNVGLYSKAVTHLKKSSALDPNHQYSHERLAWALKNQEQEEEKASAIANSAKEKIVALSQGNLLAEGKIANQG